MAKPVKGTVTSLSSVFPAEEAQKASTRVQEAISVHQSELDKLHGFISDNNNLVNLVHRLPDQLHHDIMVPFGKAAFFPGQLIHTNEFTVLLGEGYYAERTSKQTCEILKRRGNALESHVDSLKAIMKDLEAEASFFNTAAVEAAEGLVEIREELIEENLSAKLPTTVPPKSDSHISKVGNRSFKDEDEYARILARLDELEKEELAAESVEDHEGEGHTVPEHTIDHDLQSSVEHQLSSLSPEFKDGHKITGKISHKCHHDLYDQLDFEDSSKVQPIYRDESFQDKALEHFVSKPSSTGNALTFPSKVKENIRVMPASKDEVQAETLPLADSLKAFTCTIVERSLDSPTNMSKQSVASSQLSSSQSSKPVSRFKMQRK